MYKKNVTAYTRFIMHKVLEQERSCMLLIGLLCNSAERVVRPSGVTSDIIVNTRELALGGF